MSDPHRPGQAPWPEQPYGRPGETEWIPRVQDAPRRDEPFRFEEERPAQVTNPALTWALRAAGLVAIAVISGLVWSYIRDDSSSSTATPPGPTTERQEGRYQFAAHPDLQKPKVDRDCAANSHTKVQEFFVGKPCTQLTRGLYTTTVGGRQVFTAVTVVQMPTNDDAIALKKLVDGNNTGNVNDPIRAKLVQVDGLDNGVGGGGYESAQLDRLVIIVESDFAPAAKRTKDEDTFLTGISGDAIRLGQQMSTG
ncbi:hypothetical protein [Actinokineospora sp.]|uniref:hypothetical protein n=1 Tax=Actinokineospora sp. TaxID=1872133 RepID=UPI004037D108